MIEVFKYPDTNSSRAGIDEMNRRFEGMKIAIVGIGGTGSYILDLVSKTCVSEIHIFDGDVFQVHNAFRAPGACAIETFDAAGELTKVKYFAEIYSRMHNGIVPHTVYVDESNVDLLEGFDFVFISVDRNKVRSFITRKLLGFKVPFIDVGMGIDKAGGQLVGTVRVTAATHVRNEHLKNRIGSEEFAENQYATNIQVADMNCFNAALAVHRWKKMVGFYQDLKQEFNNLYSINTSKLFNEDLPEV
ncbi:MAG: hypothetical protein EOO51_00105 [Flavobacterium sp.]|nr:MAG: hypothetical protein EOO51_00105 [Flavobacterium sp.]